MNSADVLTSLQAWYGAQCDGDWEHTFGITLETLDNPGWWLKIDLAETNLEGCPFEEIRDEGSDDVWFHAGVRNEVFEAACDPSQLKRALETFLAWARLSQAEAS